MNLPPSQTLNLDAASLNETGPSSYQENQSLSQALKTQEVRNEITGSQNVSALQEAAKTAALRARQEDHQLATLDHYFVAEIKKAAGINAANSASNALAMFAAKNPSALKALLS